MTVKEVIKKLLFAILILIGCGGVTGVVLLLVYSPRYLDDVEFRCQVDMQFASLTNVLINRDGKIPSIKMSKEDVNGGRRPRSGVRICSETSKKLVKSITERKVLITAIKQPHLLA